MSVNIRYARDSDKDDVIAFTDMIFEDGDYIKYVWDEWIRDENGFLLVAEENGKPIGILHVGFLPDKSAWMEGLRVHPDYRRRGIAKKLNYEAFKIIQKRGLEVARGIIFSENNASLSLAKNLGFRLLNPTWVLAQLPYDKIRDSWGAPGDILCDGDFWAFYTSTKNSKTFKERNGFVFYSWTFFKLNKDSISWMHQNKGLNLCKIDDKYILYRLKTEKARRIEVNYIDTDADSLFNFLHKMKYDYSLEFENVQIPLPTEDKLVNEILSVGGEIREKMYVFEGNVKEILEI
ncbi:MAG: GNAT family N-acetyltransferase [Candidatus Njordarchaeia archaeon]